MMRRGGRNDAVGDDAAGGRGESKPGRRLKGRWRTALLGLAAAAVILPAAVRACDARQDSHGYLRCRMPQEPPTLDPIRTDDESSLFSVVNLFDGLVEFAPESTEVVPAVAESWTVSSDGRTYTFRLRKGVRFHSGHALTASDVVYSLRRALDPNEPTKMRSFLSVIQGAPDLWERRTRTLAGVSAPDPSTVVITLEHPFGPFLAVLASQAGSIVPKDVYDDPEEKYLTRPVGCGPFKLESWNRGVSLRFTAFPEHWKGRPGLPGIAMSILPETTTAFEEYKAGNLDVLYEIPSGQRGWAREHLREDYKIWQRLAIATVAFNHSIPPFKDNRALRRALVFAVNTERIVRALQEGKDLQATRILPPGMLGHDASPGPYRYDPEEARRLLAEAGYPEGKGLPALTYLSNNNPGILRWTEAVRADLEAVGVKTSLKVMEFGAYTATIDGTENEGPPAHLFNLTWFADYPDPDDFLGILLHTSNLGKAGNKGRYSNPAFDRLLDEGRRETDPARRGDIYGKAEKIALDDACFIPIYHYRDDALLRPTLRNFRPSPLGDYATSLELLRFAP